MCEKNWSSEWGIKDGKRETVCRLVEVHDKSFNVNDQARICEAIFISTHSSFSPSIGDSLHSLWGRWNKYESNIL